MVQFDHLVEGDKRRTLIVLHPLLETEISKRLLRKTLSLSVTIDLGTPCNFNKLFINATTNVELEKSPLSGKKWKNLESLSTTTKITM